MKKYELYKDNGGFYHIAILTDGVCTCMWTSQQYDEYGALDALEAIKSGSDPVAEGWDPLSDDPAAEREQLSGWALPGNGGASLIESGDL